MKGGNANVIHERAKGVAACAAEAGSATHEQTHRDATRQLCPQAFPRSWDHASTIAGQLILKLVSHYFPSLMLGKSFSHRNKP